MSVLRLLMKDDLQDPIAPIYTLSGRVALFKGVRGDCPYEVSTQEEYRIPLLDVSNADLEDFVISVLINEVSPVAVASREDWHDVFHEVVSGIDYDGPFALVVPERMRRWGMPSGVAEYVCDPMIEGRIYVMPAPAQFLGVIPRRGGEQGCALQDLDAFRCIIIDPHLSTLDEWLSAPAAC